MYFFLDFERPRVMFVGMIDRFLQLKSSSSGRYKVVVMTKGGTYNMYDFRRQGWQGEDNGKTLVVFNTQDDVAVTKTRDGRQFGPSILAPFSRVTVKGEAGYVDGSIIAKSLGGNPGRNAGSLQLHGDFFKGKLECIE